ncbi:MAG: Carbon-nitrogen hydrolase family protein, partial [Candidatus Hydrogenedentes bacterium]|nr:Carbon-nitrogen hydrolase family protein [Candidatus Hydrogenedentota bacterium]
MEHSRVNLLDRRTFLKTSGVGMAVLAGTGSLPLAAETGQPGEEELRPMKDKAKITLVQLTTGGGPDSVIERMPAFFAKAAEYGSDLIV